jgi:hypothetical protein
MQVAGVAVNIKAGVAVDIKAGVAVDEDADKEEAEEDKANHGPSP